MTCRRFATGAGRAGDSLIGATLNTSGALVMRADKVGSQTVLAGIVQMVAQAQRSRASMQRMADRVATSLDQGSEHPLAHAVVQGARAGGLALDKADGFASDSGIGVRGSVSGKALALGNSALMTRLRIDTSALQAQAEALRAEGASVMHLAVEGKLAGLLAVSDPVKANTAQAQALLKDSGLRVIMATGDGLTTAKAVTEKLGIVEVHGEIKPADKLALVTQLQSEGRVFAMAGDGINGAPALAKAISASPWAPAPTWR